MKRRVVKFCGFTNYQDIKEALDLDIDFIGLNNIKSSSRFLEQVQILKLIKSFDKSFASRWVILVDNFDRDFLLQLKENEISHLQIYDTSVLKSAYQLGFKIIMPLLVDDSKDLEIIKKTSFDYLLLDKKSNKLGGTGEAFDWKLFLEAKKYTDKPIFLAGGLNTSNIQEAIKTTQAEYFDLTSGIEQTPGKKSLIQMRLFKRLIDSASL